jgi:iron complex outermembrane receptor protein
VRYEQVIPQKFDSDVTEADLLGNFKIGPTTHKVLIGAYSMVLENVTANVRYGPLTPNFNVLAPAYGAGIYTVGPLVASALRSFFDQSYDWAVFGQDQISVLNDRLYFIVGGREDYNQISNTNTSPLATGQLVFTQTYTKASPRVATLFKITPGLSVYGSYDESFVPAPGTNSFAGVPLPPPTATQREAGLKYEWFDGRLSGSASAFQIERNNVSTTDPINPGFTIAVGQVKTTGWETDMATYITPHWQIYGGYGHYHNWDAVDTVSANIGEIFLGTPWWTMGVFTKYDFKGTVLNGWDIGAGVTGMSGISVNTGKFGPLTDASYVLNPEISYSWKHWRVSLNVENVLNNIYFVYASSDRYIVPGQPREIFFSVKTSF